MCSLGSWWALKAYTKNKLQSQTTWEKPYGYLVHLGKLLLECRELCIGEVLEASGLVIMFVFQGAGQCKLSLHWNRQTRRPVLYPEQVQGCCHAIMKQWIRDSKVAFPDPW